MDIRSEKLPVCIPVWPDGQTSGEAEWIEVADITFAQLDAEITRRNASIKANKELVGLTHVREYLAPHIGDRPNTVIGPVLARLAKAELEAKKRA
jgi:hypothetical protein